MKVWKRVLIKSVIFLLIVAVAGGGAASFRAYRQSTPEYAADKYMTCLIENDAKKAYVLLDQSEDKLTQKEYEAALKAKKYSLYSSFKMDEQEKRRDNEGNEFIDYRVKFLDAAGETKAEEEFTVRRQSSMIISCLQYGMIVLERPPVETIVQASPSSSSIRSIAPSILAAVQ